MSPDNLFHKKKARKENELARREAQRAPYEMVLIVCEGKKTEVNYFKGLRNFYKLNTANVEVVPSKKGSAPISVVDHAIELVEANPVYDRVYCVIDRDEHSSYDDALKKINEINKKNKDASNTKYFGITSTPCFELWFLLHFCFTSKAYRRTGKNSPCENLLKDLYTYLSGYTKNIEDIFVRLNEDSANNTARAIKHAEKLRAENKRAKSFNPDTNVHELVKYLLQLKK